MKQASFRISWECLRQILFLPDGTGLFSAVVDPQRGEIVMTVEGERLPCNGEMFATIYAEEGVPSGATWKPVPPPGPSRFLRVAGTDACFWCRRPESEHAEGLCEKYEVKS